ncbi:MAG: MmgE/PrpD family protein [Alphaproteobacteria bacterium]|nr:MmgE/PrpD family protein [Alphaproteobacteria bacterium]
MSEPSRSGPTASIGRHVAEATRQWPADARHAARRALIDALACIVAGRGDPAATTVLRAVQRWGGQGATEFAQGTSIAAPWAALVNGTAAHALDYDDVFEPALSHAGAVFVPALLALAEQEKASGAALIDALILAFDAQEAIAEGVNFGHYAKGWHTTLTLGVTATAAAAARLLGLDPERTAAAISAATSFAAGLKRQFGTQMKPVHAGMGAQAGIMAASLAAQGLTAAPEALEGPWSFADLYGPADARGYGGIDKLLAAGPAISRCGTWIKAYPCCASAHRPMRGLLDLREAEGFRAADVAAIEARVSDIVFRNLMYTDPRDEMQARFSLNHCLAVAAHEDVVRLEHFTPQAIARPEFAAFRPKVRMIHDPSIPGGDQEIARLSVRLNDGRTLQTEVHVPPGHPRRPLTDAELEAKFADCTARALSPAAQSSALQMLWRVEELASLDELIATLTGKRGRG